MALSRMTGARIKRREDPKLITGQGTYVDDIQLPGLLYLALARSPYAHARIVSVDVDAIKAMPGVVEVLTGEQVQGMVTMPLPIGQVNEFMRQPQHWPLAVGAVKHVGDPVVAIVATSRAAARDAADAAPIEYEELPAVVNPEQAIGGVPEAAGTVSLQQLEQEAEREAKEGVVPASMETQLNRSPISAVAEAEEGRGTGQQGDPNPEAATDVPKVWDQFPDNICWQWPAPGVKLETPTPEAVEEAFKNPEVHFTARLVNQRLAGVAMETRGIAAQYEKVTGGLTIWASTQVPHILRAQLALILNVSENKIRVIAPDVGGGFGIKIDVYPEDVLVPLLALKLKTPVKWSETRSEHMMAANHGRDQIQYVEVAAKRDGTITGLRVHIIAEVGAYLQLFTPAVPTFTALMTPGVYRIPAYSVHITEVFTNKTCTDAYRGAGRPEATYLIERVMDMIAYETGVDPVEVRRKNFLRGEGLELTTAAGLVYDSANYEMNLDEGLKLANYQQLRREQEQARAQGKIMGIGVATWTEICGFGPSQVFGAVGFQAGGHESAVVRVHLTGKVTVITGASSHGQGHETSFAQLVADELGIPYDDIEVLHGDTDKVPWGTGTFGSRSLAVGGAAIVMSTNKIKEKAKRIAAHLLEAAPEDVEFANGRLSVKGTDKGLAIQEVTLAAYMAHNLPPGEEPGMEATSFFDPPNFAFPFGTHIAVVDIDPDTGQVSLRKYIGVDDVGPQLNPLIVEGQLHGGIAQGAAQALSEEIVYDEGGQLVSGTLMDYAVPTAAMFPNFELGSTVTPSPVNPMGMKGVGEAGTIASTATIANAVVDALRPYGVKDVQMPFKAERIWSIIHNGK